MIHGLLEERHGFFIICVHPFAVFIQDSKVKPRQLAALFRACFKKCGSGLVIAALVGDPPQIVPGVRNAGVRCVPEGGFCLVKVSSSSLSAVIPGQTLL